MTNKTTIALAFIAVAILTTSTAYANPIQDALDALIAEFEPLVIQVDQNTENITDHETRIVSLESITVVNGTDGIDGAQGPPGVVDQLLLSQMLNDIDANTLRNQEQQDIIIDPIDWQIAQSSIAGNTASNLSQDPRIQAIETELGMITGIPGSVIQSLQSNSDQSQTDIQNIKTAIDFNEIFSTSGKIDGLENQLIGILERLDALENP